ncbi:MAG: phosphoribosylglycinamide formyltransferase [Deltaproteobacteria bacterium]|nr:phosphoribosylglycinamide formyltransferase [Deltaproteobacteria bacterium]
MLALHDAIADRRLRARMAVVVSNKASAPGLALAAARGIPTAVVESRKGQSRDEHDARVGAVLEEAGIDLVCLAGYMRIVGASFVRRFQGRILNIHPSLLPSFPGLDAQKAALEHGVRVTGCTVHLVDEEVDHGPIVLQSAVEVGADDDVESLSSRILEREHDLYWRAVALVLDGRVRVEGRRARIVPTTA